MKYLKLFEANMLDNILDKISKTGMGSLTELEKAFIDKYSKGAHKAVEQKINQKNDKYKSILTYDPREDDTDFYKDAGELFGIEDMNFRDWTDEQIEDGKYLQLWDGLYDEDMDGFLRQYKLPDNIREVSWDKLPPQIQKSFKTYIKDIGMLD